MTGKTILALALAATVGWQPAAAQREVAVEGAYLHGPARAVFPVQVGGFRRSRLLQYDSEGRDVSASYDLATPAGRLLITVYIYPAAAAAPAARSLRCDEEFASANSAISSQHGNAAPVEQGAALPAEGIDRGLGHRSVYRFASPFDDRVQDIRSEAHLYCYVGGDWLVKYRVSAPVAVETRGPVEAFIRNGPWPGRSST
ncbi:MAG TPA: hypothetical protein VF718_15015 [Allosphingosinicella sp.]|jgi:hypothetical protein